LAGTSVAPISPKAAVPSPDSAAFAGITRFA
jgi:hypothetical protein